MWLLHTARCELQEFNHPREVRYAILSHVWQKHEQTFDEIQAIAARYASPSERWLRVCAKLREFCALARAEGYEWAWADMCCINKASSAELTEAINSMFAWYARAAVCYTYLHDVPADGDPFAPGSAFRRSAWFRRGWTLQELIAPAHVVFLARDWIALGNKHTWAALLEEVSGVDADVLTFETHPSEISVARRMSWAAHRQTTRLEDEAYALMGLFGVHMPTIYGEGTRAFARLQEEIMKHSTDQSIFVWGRSLPIQRALQDDHVSLPRMGDDDLYSGLLLARSPSAFEHSADVRPIFEDRPKTSQNTASSPTSQNSTSIVVNIPFAVADFIITSNGVRAHLPLLKCRHTPGCPSFFVAILACRDKHGARLGLLLRQQEAQNHLQRFFVGGYAFIDHFNRAYHRLVRIEDTPHATSHPHRHPPASVPMHSMRLDATWKSIYIAHRVHALRSLLPRPAPSAFRAPCRLFFPLWQLAKLRAAGFVPDRAIPHNPTDAPGLWLRDTFMVEFAHHARGERFEVRVQHCAARGALWAAVHISPADERAPTPEYAEAALHTTIEDPCGGAPCRGTHVCDWPAGARAFGDAARGVRLAVSEWPSAAGHAGPGVKPIYMVTVELRGEMYCGGGGGTVTPVSQELCRGLAPLALGSVVAKRRAGEAEAEPDRPGAVRRRRT